METENLEAPTQKAISTPKETFTSGKQFAQLASELTDEEVQKAFVIINDVRLKYQGKVNSPENLEQLGDEMETRLAGVNILAKLDKTPCAMGEPPIIEIIGKIEGGGFNEYAVDHERKSWEVRKAHSKGEYRLGEKEPMNTLPAIKRSKQELRQIILPDSVRNNNDKGS